MDGNFNVVKVDSKGRIIIPFHIRDYLGLNEGTELLIINDEKRELRVLPLLENASGITVTMTDVPGSLSSILNVLAKNSVDIITSLSKTLQKGKAAQWEAIVDVSKCRNAKRLERDLKKLKTVKKVSVEKWNHNR